MLFFLHFYDGTTYYADEHGQEFPTLEMARAEARRSLLELRESGAFPTVAETGRFVVTDADGNEVALVRLRQD